MGSSRHRKPVSLFFFTDHGKPVKIITLYVRLRVGTISKLQADYRLLKKKKKKKKRAHYHLVGLVPYNFVRFKCTRSNNYTINREHLAINLDKMNIFCE